MDSRGRQLDILAVKDPRPGRDLYLTIDMELQEFCHFLLAGQRGAIVVMDPLTGAILSIVSHPTFDPNIFVSPDNKKVSELLKDIQTYPMLNRALGGTYPPGSVFKIIISACALETGVFTAEKEFLCEGSLTVGNRVFHCWKEDGHGSLNITDAL